MAEENPRLFLAEQGWAFKESGGQYVCDCPLCGKGRHLYINQRSGLWDCKRCGEAGNLYQLKARLGVTEIRPVAEPAVKTKPVDHKRIEAMREALRKDEQAMAYLRDERGYSDEVIEAMRLGVVSYAPAKTNVVSRWIAIPWLRGGECWGIKYRVLPQDQKANQRFRREPDYKSILYNVDSLARDNKTILASGETDALALLSMGFQCVVATTTGETAMPEDSVSLLKQKDRVYILYDSDHAGAESAKRIARRIGYERCHVVRLDKETKDANDFLKRHGSEAKAKLEQLLKKATRLHIPTIHQMADVIDRVFDAFARPSPKTVLDVTPWADVNRAMQAFNGLIVLSAPQGTGKTTWGLNVAEYWARHHGKPALFYCLEMTPEELTSKVLMARYSRTKAELKAEWEHYWIQALADYRETPLYLGTSYRIRSPEEIVELLRAAVRRYELQLVVFDNVHVLGRTKDRRLEVSQFTLALKDLAMEYEIPVIAVAQPKKLEPGQIMTPWDLKESVDLFSDADQLVILHRQQLGAEKDTDAYGDQQAPTLYSPHTIVRLAKSRFSGPKDVSLYLEGEYHRFRDMEPGEQIEYRAKRGGIRRTAYPASAFRGLS